MTLNGIVKKLRILVVEDDATSREVIRRILLEVGTVDAARNGQEAIDLFRAALGAGKPYDLICLDIDIPEITGHEVLSTVRREEEEFGKEGIFRTKIIMTTASNREDDVLGAFMQQCDAYCVKPIRKDVIFERMEEIGLLKAASLK